MTQTADNHFLPKHEIVNSDTGEIVDVADGFHEACRLRDFHEAKTSAKLHVRAA